MRRTLVAFLTSVAIAAGLVTAQAPQRLTTAPTPQHPIFRAGATLVAVDAYPMRDGKVVVGLTPSDFEVTEDGKPQSVEFFEFLTFEAGMPATARQDPQSVDEAERLVADPHHRAFVAYFDLYHLYAAGARNMRGPVVEFLEKTIGPADYFAALNSDVPANGLTFGQKTDAIAAAVQQYWPTAAVANVAGVPMTDHEGWLRDCFAGNVGDPHQLDIFLGKVFARSRMDVVLDSLTTLTAKLAAIREERTNVLLFSDGWTLPGPDPSLLDYLKKTQSEPSVVNGRLQPTRTPSNVQGGDPQGCNAELTRLADLNFGETFRALRDDALRRNVAFYPIEPDGLAVFGEQLTTTQGRPPTFAQTDLTLAPLRDLALGTNGDWVMRTNDIRTPMLALTDAFASYYLLGYYTTNTNLDGKYRTINVKVTTPGVKVTARHGYLATANGVASTTSTGGAAAPETTALDALSRLDSADSVLVSASPTPGEVLVAAEVSSAQASSVAKGADVRVTLAASGGAPLTGTGHIDAGFRSALIHVPVGQTAGPWQATVSVSGADGPLTASLSVPPPAAGLVGEPMLYHATPSPRSPLWPSAGHRFSRTERLHIEWPTTGPLDSHVGRLLDRRGSPLAVAVTLAEPPPAAGGTRLVGDVSLAPLAAGDYLLELVVGRGGSTERHLIAIRVEQ